MTSNRGAGFNSAGPGARSLARQSTLGGGMQKKGENTTPLEQARDLEKKASTRLPASATN